MTPLIYYLEALDARVYVTIVDLHEKTYLVGHRPLYDILANGRFINKYRNYSVQSVDMSKVDGQLTVFLRVEP